MATFKVGDRVVTILGRGDVVDVVEGAIDGVEYQAGIMVKLYTPIAEGSKFWFDPGELQPADPEPQPPAPARRSPQEIETLKAQWRADGCWDIEDSEGFEAHRDELRAYRLAYEAAAAQREADRLQERAAALGCTVDLVRELERLQSEIAGLRRSVFK